VTRSAQLETHHLTGSSLNSHTMSPNVNHHYSSGPQNSGIGSVSRARVSDSEIQPSLVPLQVTGANFKFCDPSVIRTEFFHSPSPQSPQPSSSQDLPWKKKEILCYRDRWQENMADKICAERGTASGMERECRCLVRNVILVFLLHK
jgi:hypothetical protein